MTYRDAWFAMTTRRVQDPNRLIVRSAGSWTSKRKRNRPRSLVASDGHITMNWTATPAVVPSPNHNRSCVPLSEATLGVGSTKWNHTSTAMQTMLFATGAHEPIANLRRTFNNAVAMPMTP